MFGNIAIDSFTIIKTPYDDDSKYYYSLTDLVTNANNYFLNIRKTYFTFDINA